MSDTVVLYTNPSSRGRIAHWMLEEVGAPYQIKVLSFDKQEHKQPAFLAVNPMGKVPAIVHRGVVVTETAAICTYLADAFAAAKLAPALDDPARGTYLRWLFFAAGCVEAALIDRMYSRPLPERSLAVGYGSYESTMSTLERAVTPGPYLLGERFSAADVYIMSEINWGLMTKAIEPRPAFMAYVAHAKERPAYRRFVEQGAKLQEQLEA